MMEAVHATEEWQRGVHYIRIQAMCVGFDIPLKYEFADDTATVNTFWFTKTDFGVYLPGTDR